MGAFDVCNTKKQRVNAIFMRYSSITDIYVYLYEKYSVQICKGVHAS